MEVRFHPSLVEMNARLDLLDNLTADAVSAYMENSEGRHGNISMFDELVMAMQLRGIRTEEFEPGNTKRETFLGVFFDPQNPEAGEALYHTAPFSGPVVSTSPFRAVSGDTGNHVLYNEGIHSLEVPILEYGTYSAAYDHYFPHITRDGKPLPFNLTVNPWHTCAESCVGCSRATTFTSPGKNFIDAHLDAVFKSYATTFPQNFKEISPFEYLKYVAIITGCQPTTEKEFEMFQRVIEGYRNRGATQAEFSVFSSHISTPAQMDALAKAGVSTFVRTVETTNDDVRSQVWSTGKKGRISFEDHLNILTHAQDYFPMREATLVLGTDPQEQMMDGIEKLSEAGASVIAYMPRIYDETFLSTMHPDVFKHGIHYFSRAFDAILEGNKENIPSSRYMRKYLQEDIDLLNLNIAPDLIPRRYRA